MFKEKKCVHILVVFNWARLLLFSCFVACLVPSSFFKNHANLFFFNVHDINCIVLLWALLCAFVCQLLPLPLCERSLCCCAWFMLLAYVNFFLAASTLVFYTSQLFFNVISCRCLFLSSGSFYVETTVVPVVFLYQFLIFVVIVIVIVVVVVVF